MHQLLSLSSTPVPMGKLRQHHRHLLGQEAPTPPAPSSFDMNMVIILAALLCALIFALGLNSIVRCALRCGRRLSSLELPEDAAAAARATAAAGRRGLKRSALRHIPVAVYGEGGVRVVSTDCTICLGEFVGGEKVRVLPKCNHGFHVGCVDAWLVKHSSCPTCRLSMADAGGLAVAGGSVGGVEENGGDDEGG